jgi:enoyl-CoA hydratase/carnithine racemase
VATNVADMASAPGFLVVDFERSGGDGSPLPWTVVEAWVRSRAVTVAVLGGVVASPALDIALCSDLVYLLPSARLCLAPGAESPSPGVIWALGRAGRRALARGLLSTADIPPGEAVEIGVAHQMLEVRGELPLPAGASVAAATSARDLMRSARPGSGGLALELAAFRLLFAAGDPKVGAAAFFDKREPSF